MTMRDISRWSPCLALGLLVGCAQILGIDELPRRGRDAGAPDGRPPDASGPGCVAGETCDTGSPCELGETRCVPDGAVCVVVGPAPATTLCRPAAGVCDVGELCDGAGSACPADVRSAAGTACMVNGEAGSCTGLGADCAVGCLAGTPCSTGNACEDGEIECSTGEPRCVSAGIKAAGTTCRGAVDACDVVETCDGVSPSCPADATRPDGTDCSDPGTCNAYACFSGLCQFAGDTCPSCRLCTVDTCEPSCDPGCPNDCP